MKVRNAVFYSEKTSPPTSSNHSYDFASRAVGESDELPEDSKKQAPEKRISPGPLTKIDET